MKVLYVLHMLCLVYATSTLPCYLEKLARDFKKTETGVHVFVNSERYKQCKLIKQVSFDDCRVVAIDKNGKYMAVGYSDVMCVYNVQQDTIEPIYVHTYEQKIVVICTSDDGIFVAAGYADGALFVHDIQARKLILHKEYAGEAYNVIFSDNNKYIAVAHRNNMITVHAFAKDNGLHTLCEFDMSDDDEDEERQVFRENPVFSPNSRYVAYGYDKSRVFLYDIQKNKRVILIPDNDQFEVSVFDSETSITSVVFSKDSESLFFSVGMLVYKVNIKKAFSSQVSKTLMLDFDNFFDDIWDFYALPFLVVDLLLSNNGKLLAVIGGHQFAVYRTNPFKSLFKMEVREDQLHYSPVAKFNVVHFSQYKHYLLFVTVAINEEGDPIGQTFLEVVDIDKATEYDNKDAHISNDEDCKAATFELQDYITYLFHTHSGAHIVAIGSKLHLFDLESMGQVLREKLGFGLSHVDLDAEEPYSMVRFIDNSDKMVLVYNDKASIWKMPSQFFLKEKKIKAQEKNEIAMKLTMFNATKQVSSRKNFQRMGASKLLDTIIRTQR